MDRHRSADVAAVVLVRPTSPFLPKSVLARRQQLCVDVAVQCGYRVEVVAPIPDRPFDSILGAALLLTWSAHGLVTTPAELDALRELMTAGLRVYEAQSGAMVSVDVARLTATVPAHPHTDRDERRIHAARTRQGRHDVARDGRWLGGRRPLGWVFDTDGNASLDLTAARYIRAGTERVAAGATVGSVAAVWNNAGFTTVTGRTWTSGATRRVLLRARNAGLVEYHGAIVGRSAWPAIVTVAEWQTVVAALCRPDRRCSSTG